MMEFLVCVGIFRGFLRGFRLVSSSVIRGFFSGVCLLVRGILIFGRGI